MEDKRVVFYIIVPVYNSERFLRRCTTSIIQQSFSDYRLILINDGSTDSSGAICDSFAKDNRNVIVLHQTNQGQILARLAGIKYAKDDARSLQNTESYIVFADSDDSLKPKALEKIHTAIIDNNYADLIVYGYDKVSESGTVLEKYNQKIYFSGYTSDKHTILKTITAKTLYNYTINKASISFTMNPVKGIEDTIVGTAFILMQFKSLDVLSNEDLKYFYIDNKRTLLSKISGIVNTTKLTKHEKLKILDHIATYRYFSDTFSFCTGRSALHLLTEKKTKKAYHAIQLWSLGQFFKFAYIKPRNAIMAFIKKDRKESND